MIGFVVCVREADLRTRKVAVGEPTSEGVSSTGWLGWCSRDLLIGFDGVAGNGSVGAIV